MIGILRWCVYLSVGSRPLLAASVLLMAVGPLLGWYQFQWTQRFFDGITHVSREEWKLAVWLAFGLFAIKLAESSMSRIGGYVQETLALRVNRRIDAYQFELVQPSEITRIETPAYQNDLHLLKNSLTKIGQIMQTCLTVAKELGTVLVYAYLVGRYSWAALVLVFGFAFPNLLYVWKHARRLDDFFARISQAQMEAGKLAGLLTLPMALKEMLIFGAKPFFLSRWHSVADRSIREHRRLIRSEYGWGWLVDSFVPVKFIATQLIFIYMLFQGRMQLGEYMALTGAMVPLENSLRSLIVSLDGLKHFQLFRSKWAHFRKTYMPDPSSRTQKAIGELRSIELEGLTFSYPDSDRPALREVSFRLEGISSLAIVGENGSGKSTLAKAMSGLHRVEEGRMRVNGIPVEDVDRSSLYGRVSIVSQDFVRYPLSVYENIALRERPGPEEDGRFRELVGRYPELIPEEVRARPDVRLGIDYLGSVQLSGGQWQRIAIARGLYKDCDVLVLDEATSELDPAAERDIVRKILEDRADRTTLLVTHNMQLACMADCVVVMERGTIAESGPPSSLLNRASRFKDMLDKQNAISREEQVADELQSVI